MSDLKTGKGKCPLDAVPLGTLKGAARVFEHGYHPAKYARGNWHTAEDAEIGNRYAGALLRHLADAQRPDGAFDLASLASRDRESGLPEIDHAICGLLILRGLLTKRGALPEDPGMSRLYEAPAEAPTHAGGIAHIVSAAAARFDARPIERASVEARAELAPADVHTPHIFEEGDPRRVRPFCAPEEAAPVESDPRRARPFERPTGPGDPAPVKGPRFVVMRKGDVPAGAIAEVFSSRDAQSWADDWNAGKPAARPMIPDLRSPNAVHYTHAVVDTRPEKG